MGINMYVEVKSQEFRKSRQTMSSDTRFTVELNVIRVVFRKRNWTATFKTDKKILESSNYACRFIR